MRNSILAALTALALATPAIADDIQGVYKGIIFSGGDYPGTTIFTISDQGKIGATYVFDTENGLAPGELKDCWFEARMLRCIWVDEFGQGDFMALFEPDFRSFVGAWFDSVVKGIRPGLEGGFPWTGKRVD